MTTDRDLLALHLAAVLVFAAIALYTPRALAAFSRKSRLKPAPPRIILVMRLWFASLAAASLWLLLLGPHGTLKP